MPSPLRAYPVWRSVLSWHVHVCQFEHVIKGPDDKVLVALLLLPLPPCSCISSSFPHEVYQSLLTLDSATALSPKNTHPSCSYEIEYTRQIYKTNLVWTKSRNLAYSLLCRRSELRLVSKSTGDYSFHVFQVALLALSVYFFSCHLPLCNKSIPPGLHKHSPTTPLFSTHYSPIWRPSTPNGIANALSQSLAFSSSVLWASKGLNLYKFDIWDLGVRAICININSA